MALFGNLFKKEEAVKSQMGTSNLTVLPNSDDHNMSLNKYEVKAVYKPTNRFRKLVLFGRDIADILSQLTDYNEPDFVTQIAYDFPTEAQLSYAKKLKIRIPKKCCKEDMSALIDEAVRKEKTGKSWKHVNPGKELAGFAEQNHIPYSLYGEEFRVIRDIWSYLNGAEQIAFMIACMAKHVNGKWNFKKWDQWVQDGAELVENKTFLRSLSSDSKAGMNDGFYGFDWDSISERAKAYQMLKERI